MSKRVYIFEHEDVIKHHQPTIDLDLKIIIPVEVEIENYCSLKVGGLQVYGYEFDMSYTKNEGITLPTGKLTKHFWWEFVKEFENLKFFLGNYQDVEDWF